MPDQVRAPSTVAKGQQRAHSGHLPPCTRRAAPAARQARDRGPISSKLAIRVRIIPSILEGQTWEACPVVHTVSGEQPIIR
jgi:hypothetical protein